ncbi:MAG TPA: recombinase family protein [Pseudonocardiaceae bacterium]|nr:recombinase family protein [Pseudonocardiaceae bacterium]
MRPTDAEDVDCPTCGAPTGSPCRARSGTTALKYHTPRFLLVPSLRDEHEVDVPADRGPGQPWREPPVTRVGYGVPSDVAALRAAGCRPVVTETVGPTAKARPELDRALALAAGAVLTVHELRRLARSSAELVAVAAALRDVRLEILAGPLAGRHGPQSALRGVLSALAELDRDHLRELIMAGQRTAAAEGRRGGRPRVFDDEMVATARLLRDQGVPVPEIARRLTIPSSGRHPSVASVYRALSTQELTHELDQRR